MSVVLYGIADAFAPASSGPGLAGRPLRSVTTAELAAVVSDLEDGRAPVADELSLWEYEEVLERLMANATIIPARFGTVAQDDLEIAATLAARHSEFIETLVRVHEAVEFAVRAPDPIGPWQNRDTDRPGTAYIERLRERDRRIRELDADADRLIRARRRTARGNAYLVGRGTAWEFVQHARRLDLTVTGPWPPYSFTGGP
jgi:hypothetical protein